MDKQERDAQVMEQIKHDKRYDQEKKLVTEHQLTWLNETETLTPVEKLLLKLRYRKKTGHNKIS